MNIIENKENGFDFKFSVVMAIYNSEDYIYEAIDSLINQTIGFSENIQLVLVDDGSEDSSYNICLEYQSRYPDNITVVSQENGGQASARNNGLQYVKGKYINFMDSDDRFALDAFEKVYDFFEAHHDETDIVSIPIFFFGRASEEHILNEKFGKSRIIDLEKDPNNVQLHTNSAFIRNECFKGSDFPTDVIFSEDAIVVNRILLEKKTLGVLNTTKYHYRKRFDESSTIDTARLKKEFYNDKLTNYFLYLIDYAKEREGKVPRFLQYMLAYDLQWVFEQADLSVLSDSEREDYFKYLREILDEIPSDVILNNPYIRNPFRRDYFLYMKEGDLHYEVDEGNDVLLKTNDHIIDRIRNHKIWFDIIEFDNGFLYMSGLFNSLYDIRHISIEAIREKSNGEKNHYVGKYARYTSRRDKEFLGETFQFRNNFDIRIPVEEGESSRIRIRINFHRDGDNGNFDPDNVVSNYLGIDFQPHAKFSRISNYKFKGSNIIYFDNGVFTLIPYSFKNHMKKEYFALRNLIKSGGSGSFSAILLRLFHLGSYPFFRKFKRGNGIYLFEDRIGMADDNAEHLFRYALEIDDDVKKYFVLSGDSPDFKRLSKLGNVLKHGSFKHKLLVFHADKMISSHPYESVINPFYGDEEEDRRSLYAGLIGYKVYFLQHGVTLGNISSWLSKFDKNLSLIVTVSPLERESFLVEGYNYDESVIQVLGFPRYDNLKNNKNKQVLIIPSWRRYLRQDKDVFLNSSYYEDLNSLLNNRDFIDRIRNAGYRIVFKPHPELNRYYDDDESGRYVDLLDIPDDIELSADESYQELFNNSTLMITDYSSVFFDFAYLKKPVIYYQKEQDYHYDEGYFDIETMGFGDIINNEEELIGKVDFYLNNECSMEDKYIKRVDDFFKYDDLNNCQRVYDWIKGH